MTHERVLLLDVDSAVPNLALMKLAGWHRDRGDEVALNAMHRPDKVYASCVFTWGRRRLEQLRAIWPDLESGGSGEVRA